MHHFYERKCMIGANDFFYKMRPNVISPCMALANSLVVLFIAVLLQIF